MRVNVQWNDLLAYRPWQIAHELSLPLPWFALAMVAGHHGWYVIEFMASLLVFTAGLRIAHNTFHRALGIPARANAIVMFCLSALMAGSMHAVRHTHLAHHRDSLADDDIEGRVATLGFWRALISSPVYPLLIHIRAIRSGSRREQIAIAMELATVALVQTSIWLSENHTLKTFSLAMLFANALAPMPGIWAVHRAHAYAAFKARTLRPWWLDALSFNMFYHLEHHLYPAVPTRNIAELARRLDAACESITKVCGRMGGIHRHPARRYHARQRHVLSDRASVPYL